MRHLHACPGRVHQACIASHDVLSGPQIPAGNCEMTLNPYETQVSVQDSVGGSAFGPGALFVNGVSQVRMLSCMLIMRS